MKIFCLSDQFRKCADNKTLRINVYHNIPSKDRQAILLETLRTLKKGGTFAIHDIFSEAKYGDMQSFIKKLKEMGYEKVDLIDTTNDKWIMKSEAHWMGLSGSALLTGTK